MGTVPYSLGVPQIRIEKEVTPAAEVNPSQGYESVFFSLIVLPDQDPIPSIGYDLGKARIWIRFFLLMPDTV